MVFNIKVNCSKCIALQSIPVTLNLQSLETLLTVVDKLNICAGHPELHFIKMLTAKKGKILAPTGKVSAYLDENTVVNVNSKLYTKTVRTPECEVLCNTVKCSVCKCYQPNLRSIYSCWVKKVVYVMMMTLVVVTVMNGI